MLNYCRCLMVIVMVLLAGCHISAAPESTPVPTETPARLPGAWEDAAQVMAGICFESAYDAAGTVFVLRGDEELNTFFDLADHSRLCRRPVTRQSYDFSDDRVLVGTWSSGHGCTAQHEVTAIDQDDAEQILTFRVRFSTQGDCPYELVRPFWVGMPDASDYTINLVME